MPTISVYIIAYNEVAKVQPAIESVSWADEVILVDSNSTDGTAELAQSLGARVVQVEFKGFGHLRNQAIAACTKDWIFSLDADERCTPQAAQEIQTLINSPQALDVYHTPRRNYFMGKWIKHSGWYPNYRQPQLFRRGAMSYDMKPVHEGYVLHSNKPVGHMVQEIWQFPFKNMTEVMHKANRYSSLGAEKIKHKKITMFTALSHGIWAFVKHFFFKKGFLDGWAGFVIALGNFEGTFFRYVKAIELQQGKRGRHLRQAIGLAMNKEDRALYIRLMGFLKPYWKAFSIAVACMVCTAATEPMFPAIMKYLLDSGFQTADKKMVWLIPASIVLLFVVRGLLSFVTNYLMTWVSTRLVVDLRRAMFDKLLSAPTQVFQSEPASRWISRLLYDVDNINQAATNVLVTALRESLTAIALLSYLLYLDWRLTLVTLTVGPIIAILIQSFGKRIRKASKASLESLRAIAHTVEETTAANRVIKVYGGQEQQRARFHRVTENFRRSMMREAVPASALTPITHIAASLAIAFIIFMALSRSMGQAGDSAGGFVSFITAMLLLISPIKQLTTISPILQRGLAACESVFGVLDAEPEPDSGKQSLAAAKGELAFENVSFQYPGSERNALENISFTAKPGQTVALVGASGGGKSSLAALIPRFFSPISGRITIDGVDIANLTLPNLRKQIALVSQDIVLLNDTIRANISFGEASEASDAQVRDAAIAAHAWEFISKLPNGLDTPVGENGATLSGGQRQRIAIARALLKNAPILILDEATSALDTESERMVQQALALLMRNRTTLVVAHRLSTIEGADLILVMDQGRIVERGNHSSLVKANGYYASLQRLQT